MFNYSLIKYSMHSHPVTPAHTHTHPHSLGLRHDGDPQARCSSDPLYLMAPTFAESLNPHMWSSCSREQLTKLLRYVSVATLYVV